jgi:hypothetical protein
MDTIKDLELRIDGAINILHKAKDFFKRCKSFFDSSLTEEEKSLINRLQIIKDSIHSFWVITILELCKLADDSNSQKHNLFLLLRDIRNDWHKLKLENVLSLKELEEIELKINSTLTSERIVSIKTLRNKYYAHTDINNIYPEVELIPSFKKIDALINDLEDVLKDLKSKILKVAYVPVSIYQGDYLLLKDLLIGINQNNPKK